MTISYLPAPIPKWVIMNQSGTAAGGAKLYTKSNLDRTVDKAVYQDDAGVLPYTNPVIFDENGTQGPFYWEIDSANTSDTYFLQAFDSDDNLLWTIEDFTPPSGGGGGGGTTVINSNNLISNGVFLDNSGNSSSPTNNTNIVLAPSNHQGFTPDLVNPVIGTYGAVGPDIRFVKNNTNATDQITFVTFTAGDNPLTGDATPLQYLRYSCTNTPAGETFKALQFPICRGVSNLDNQSVTFTCWARVAASAVTLNVYVRQYFGSGGSPSAEVRTSIGTMALTTSWTKFVVQGTVPTVAAKTLGDCGDDALYFQLEYPLGVTCDAWVTKPSLYVGSNYPALDFLTNDQIDAITYSERTGTIMPSYRISSRPPPGWILMDDGTIGDVGSGATTRANIDTFSLFKTLWDCVSDSYAPVSGGRGASAVADFSAGKTIRLPQIAARGLGAAGTGTGLTVRALGETAGSETHTLTVNEMPSHNHPGSSVSIQTLLTGGTTASALTTGGTTGITIAAQGGGAAHSILSPFGYATFFIKL